MCSTSQPRGPRHSWFQKLGAKLTDKVKYLIHSLVPSACRSRLSTYVAAGKSQVSFVASPCGSHGWTPLCRSRSYALGRGAGRGRTPSAVGGGGDLHPSGLRGAQSWHVVAEGAAPQAEGTAWKQAQSGEQWERPSVGCAETRPPPGGTLVCAAWFGRAPAGQTQALGSGRGCLLELALLQSPQQPAWAGLLENAWDPGAVGGVSGRPTRL